jgi:hypothetical protein
MQSLKRISRAEWSSTAALQHARFYLGQGGRLARRFWHLAKTIFEKFVMRDAITGGQDVHPTRQNGEARTF